MFNDLDMRTNSQRNTWIGVLAGAVNYWRNENKWSRETVADVIVEAHIKADIEHTTGISFEAKSRDEWQRMHTNANKIFRWLDELTKDTNLLPANFIHSILIAMPMPLRLRTVNTLLFDLELSAHSITNIEKELEPLDMLRNILNETSQVTHTYAQLVDGIDPGELEQALAATNSALTELNQAKENIQTLMHLERITLREVNNG